MKKVEMTENAATLAKIMIATIRNGKPIFRGYKFRSEKALLKRIVASGTDSIQDLNFEGIKCFKNVGITKLSQVICMSDEEIKNIKGLGAKKAEEVAQAIDKIRERICCEIFSGNIDEGTNIAENIKTSAPSVYVPIKILPNDKQKEILEARLAGMNLEYIAAVFGMTRERVRQIQNKGIEKARKIAMAEFGTSEFAEDAYKYFFKEYSTDKEFWNQFSENGINIFAYLDVVYGYGSGKRKLEEALDDSNVSAELKAAVENYINRGKIVVDGTAVSINRNNIEEYLIKTCCANPITIQAFMAKYNEFIVENGLAGELSLVSMADVRNYASRFERKESILWLGSNTFRFYDFTGKDFSKLLEGLAFNNYVDTEISAAVFYQNYPELMKEFDIRDEYELHYILKAIVNEKEYSNIHFGRTPMIEFGNSDRGIIVFTTMVKMAPVTKKDLVKAISKETGVNEATIRANWLDGILRYYNNGMYRFDIHDYGFLYKKGA